MDISVNLGAIKKNLSEIRAHIGKGVKLTFMVKADAYNHGIQRVALATKDLVDAYGVATAKEGALLRLMGIENRILVTAFTELELDEVELYRLTPVLTTLSSVKAYARAGREFDISLDTGMCREGLTDTEIPAALRFLQENFATPRAFCTHLAYTDERRDAQLHSFLCMAEQFSCPSAKLHIANSDAALTDSRFLLDEVRVGIAAYGGLDGFGMTPAMSVTAPVEFIKQVKKGSCVGYDGLYKMEEDGELAFVRAGYYDGIPRSLRGAFLLINGQKARIAGNISMDSFLLDVSGLHVKSGDLVEYLSGKSTARALAIAAGTIPYEILTSLKGRNMRNYYGETIDTSTDIGE